MGERFWACLVGRSWSWGLGLVRGSSPTSRVPVRTRGAVGGRLAAGRQAQQACLNLVLPQLPSSRAAGGWVRIYGHEYCTLYMAYAVNMLLGL